MVKVESLKKGKIPIPKKCKEEVGLEEGDQVAIKNDSDVIKIKKLPDDYVNFGDI